MKRAFNGVMAGLVLYFSNGIAEAKGPYTPRDAKPQFACSREYNLDLQRRQELLQRTGSIDSTVQDATLGPNSDDIAKSNLEAALGLNLYNKGKFQEALEHWQKAVSLNPNQSGYQNDLARTYKKLGNKEKSLNHFHKAVELNPSNSTALFNLGSTYFSSAKRLIGSDPSLSRKYFDQALITLGKYILIFPKGPKFKRSKKGIRLITNKYLSKVTKR